MSLQTKEEEKTFSPEVKMKSSRILSNIVSRRVEVVATEKIPPVQHPVTQISWVIAGGLSNDDDPGKFDHCQEAAGDSGQWYDRPAEHQQQPSVSTGDYQTISQGNTNQASKI